MRLQRMKRRENRCSFIIKRLSFACEQGTFSECSFARCTEVILCKRLIFKQRSRFVFPSSIHVCLKIDHLLMFSIQCSPDLTQVSKRLVSALNESRPSLKPSIRLVDPLFFSSRSSGIPQETDILSSSRPSDFGNSQLRTNKHRFDSSFGES